MRNGVLGGLVAGVLGGVDIGLQRKRKQELEDEERAQREQDREDRRRREKQAEDDLIALRRAGTPATVDNGAVVALGDGQQHVYDSPDVASSDVRQANRLAEGGAPMQQGIVGLEPPAAQPGAIALTPRASAAPAAVVNGQAFPDRASAEAAAAQYNDPVALSNRVATTLQSQGKFTEALQFQQQAEKFGQERFRRRLGESLGGGFGGIESFVNESEAGPFKGKQVKFVPSADGKTVTLHVVKDGKLTPTSLSFPNDERGPIQAAYMLDQAVTPEARYKLMVENDRKDRDLERKEEESKSRVALAETRADTARTQAEVALLRADIAKNRADSNGDGKVSREERLRWTSLHSESGRRLSEAQKALTTLQADPAFMVRAKKAGSPEAAQLANLQDDVRQYKEDRDMYADLLGGSQARDARAERGARPAAAPAAAGKPGASGGKGKVPAPTTKAEYDAIPKGTKYQHPDDPPGTYRTKK